MADPTITSFFQRAISRDFSRDFLFRVVSLGFGSNGLNLTENDLLYAKTATLPERTIVNQPVKYRGLEFQLPGSVTYGSAASYAIDFYCEASSNLRQRLITESRRVFNDQTTTGDYNIGGPDAVLTLAQLDKQLAPVTEFKLYGVSIRTVGQVSYDMAGGSGAVVSFPCNIAYHYFTELAFSTIGPDGTVVRPSLEG